MLKVTRYRSHLAAMALPLGMTGYAHAEVNSLQGMISEGKVNIDLRLRFEGVDQDGFDEDAEAITLRSRLGFTSASWNGISFMGEFDDVSHLSDDDFNSTDNGKTQFPVIADPEGTEINQAWLKYAFSSGSATYGRQRILMGDQRFVGGVAWRQNEQTYDGFRALLSPSDSLKIDLSYVYNVNRLFGPDDGPVQPGDLKGDNVFFRTDWQIMEGHNIAGYAYLLDIDEDDGYPAGRTVDNSSDTYGVEYSGAFGPLSARAAYAQQSDAGDSNLSYDADYYLLEGAFKVSGITLKAGYEVLGGDNGVGFKTPYATLHKFQGWADKFLATPGDGVEDAYLGLLGKMGPVKLGAFYHDFQAEDASADFGTEVDLVATWPATQWLTLQAKYASFDSDDASRFTDTDKIWFTAQIKL